MHKLSLTVKQLKEQLKYFPDNAVVVLASDPEQNSMSVAQPKLAIGTIGEKVDLPEYNYSFIDGTDIDGVDIEQDKGIKYCLIQPLY